MTEGERATGDPAPRGGVGHRAVDLLDRWRFSLLLLLILTAFFLQPLLNGVPFGGSVQILVYAAIFGGAIHVTGPVIGLPRWMGAIVILWALVTILAGDAGSVLAPVALVLSLALGALVTWCTLAALLMEAKADADALAGAVFGYFLLALLWGVVYLAVEAWAPGAFALPEGSDKGTDLLYFSIVTLTTLGYGDILPVAPFAKILAGLEAAVGTLYLAILIGRIVGALKAPKRRRPAEAPSSDAGAPDRAD